MSLLAIIHHASYPIFVHRLTVSFHASFPRSVTLTQLHFISLAVVSSREDFHLQDRAHAGRTHPRRMRVVFSESFTPSRLGVVERTYGQRWKGPVHLALAVLVWVRVCFDMKTAEAESWRIAQHIAVHEFPVRRRPPTGDWRTDAQ